MTVNRICVGAIVNIIHSTYSGDGKPYLCGGGEAGEPSVADFFAATVLVQLDWIGFEFSLWNRVNRWLHRLKSSDLWDAVHEKHDGFVVKLQSSQESLAT